MAVIQEVDNETTQQSITLAGTTYILEGGSISFVGAAHALDVAGALGNITILLWGGLIENSNGTGTAHGISSASSIRVELSDDAMIRATGGAAIRTSVIGAGIDLVNHGTVSNASAAISTIAGDSGTGRVVNFGVIKGITTTAGVVALGGNSTMDNFGLIDAGLDTNVAVAFGGGDNTLDNAGTILGAISMGIGTDTFRNRGLVVGEIDLGAGADFYIGLPGGSYTDSVDGGDGDDQMMGTDWADRFNGEANDDTLSGAGGDDVLQGGAGEDVLIGGSGDDFLFGGTEDDVLAGGTGSDLIDGGSGIDVVTYAGTFSAVRVSLSDSSSNAGAAAGDAIGNVENLIGTVFADHLTGDGGTNELQGSDGGDTLNGLGGNDTLLGGNGSDTLDGGAGTDIMDGGANGDDTYYVDVQSDQIIDASGTDTVFASTSFTLGGGDAIEIFRVVGGAGLALNGNEFGQQIFGGDGADILSGFGGADIIVGGRGRDTMTGGLGNDVFKFLAKTHSAIGTTRDRLTDFDDLGNDTIDLSLLFGKAMTYRHSKAFTAAGQVRINDVAGADVLVEVNTGGTLAADFTIRLTGTTLASMTKSDFIL